MGWCQTSHLLSAENVELPLRQPEEEIEQILAKSLAQAQRPASDAGFRAKEQDAMVAEISHGHE
ncbi:unnamed protein product, partial [Effrenium voratum]